MKLENGDGYKNHLRNSDDKDLIIFLKKGKKFKIYVL